MIRNYEIKSLLNCPVAAKGEYSELKRELSRISRISTHASQLEEGTAAADEFNLDEFLNGLRQDQNTAGHELKNLGLIWKNLTVKVKYKKIIKCATYTKILNDYRARLLMHIRFQLYLHFFSSGSSLAWESAKTKKSF